MEEEYVDTSKSQESQSQSHSMYFSNPLMGDFVSDWSPLHDASIHGCLLTLKKLINQGTSVNLLTADRVSPLHEACLGGHSACTSVLLKHGAHVNGATVDWNTPLFNACISGSIECLNLLLQHGASPHAVCDLASPIHEAAKRGANANVGKGLESPLHMAAQNANSELVHLLIDFGADTSALNAQGKKPTELVPPNSTLAQIFLQREGPLSLMQLCRLCIRRCLGSKQQHGISQLLLPDELKQFLLYL
ncbi:ankyrin repeat and SOCS box protein 9 isoform X4 [Sphaerodactylus townsendi]|uniref:ankyrin repeat and SOCS box protein 9 isoform X4 n=1 Tax=Sphaerodactylus townsendi TaxID=933632 RepID=UPI0020273B1A|nr:ankyrin repeat and SOCS box protein 9 isoform X4 [Sphaerodactylus townsendi]